MNFKNFRSAIGDLYVQSTTGHSAIITNTFSNVPDTLWANAYSMGAISEDMVPGSEDEYIRHQKELAKSNLDTTRESYKQQLEKLIDAPGNVVNTAGYLNMMEVSKYLKEPVAEELINSIWEEIQQEKLSANPGKRGRPPKGN